MLSQFERDELQRVYNGMSDNNSVELRYFLTLIDDVSILTDEINRRATEQGEIIKRMQLHSK